MTTNQKIMTETNTMLSGDIIINGFGGEVFTVVQDNNGFFGYTSNKGYNSWEGTVTKNLITTLKRLYETIKNSAE